MNESEHKDLSSLRQALRRTEEQRSVQVETLLAERGPLIRGTYRLQGGRCGRPGCRCTRGELHEKAMLYHREEGTFRCSYVPLADRERVDQLSRRYRRVRKARAALVKLAKKSIELADALQQTLTEPYPAPHRSNKKKRHKGRTKEPPS